MSISIPVIIERTPENNSYENEIRAFFDRHWETYLSQRELIRCNIETWRQRTIDRIHEFANEQIQILHDELIHEKQEWGQKFQDNLETIQSCVSAQNFDLIDEVRRQCQQLEYQVARIENIKREFEFPQIVTVRQQKERDKQKRHESIQQSDQSSLKPLNFPTKTTTDLPISRSSPSKDNEPSQSLLATTISSAADSSLADNSALVQGNVELENDANCMCFICFMLYPPTMSHYDRYHHVQEHLTDND